MTSTPDAIGSDKLQELIESAPETNSTNEGPYDGLTKEQLSDLVKRTLDTFDERCQHPVAQKLMALVILSNGIGFHTRVGNSQFKNDDNKSGTSWLRDAGKLQAALALFESVSYGPGDFTFE